MWKLELRYDICQWWDAIQHLLFGTNQFSYHYDLELQLVTEVITAPEWLIHYQLNGSNDIEIAMKKGLFQRAAVCAELGEVILGAKAGRETPLEMTLFALLYGRRDTRCCRGKPGVREGEETRNWKMDPNDLASL